MPRVTVRCVPRVSEGGVPKLGEKWKIEGVVEITIILRIRDRKPGL